MAPPLLPLAFLGQWAQPFAARSLGWQTLLPLFPQPYLLYLLQSTRFYMYRCMGLSGILLCWKKSSLVQLQMFYWLEIEAERQSECLMRP